MPAGNCALMAYMRGEGDRRVRRGGWSVQTAVDAKHALVVAHGVTSGITDCEATGIEPFVPLKPAATRSWVIRASWCEVDGAREVALGVLAYNLERAA